MVSIARLAAPARQGNMARFPRFGGFPARTGPHFPFGRFENSP